jgi:hypothetical protein
MGLDAAPKISYISNLVQFRQWTGSTITVLQVLALFNDSLSAMPLRSCPMKTEMIIMNGGLEIT